MDIKSDILYIKIDEKSKWFKQEASKHKSLNWRLWFSASFISISVAVFANFEFSFYGVTSGFLTAFLSIILPVVTGYTVLRSPESLWVLEIDMRNRLTNLMESMVFIAERNPDFDREPFEKDYLAIMGAANSQWRAIKETQGND